MSLHITQREQTWILEVNERWIFEDDELCVKVMKYLMARNIPFGVHYGIGKFISLQAVKVQNDDFAQFLEIVNEIMKLKKAYGDVNSKLPG